MNRRASQHGFTIVELLIVVVVIAILAAIIIVAYNGIQNRAKSSALQSATSQAGKKVAEYFTLNTDTYPASLGVMGINDTATTQYNYLSVANATNRGYCVSGQTPSAPSTSVAFSSVTGNTTSGSCITNRVTNPSVEEGTTGVGLAVNSAVGTRSAAAALVGDYGISVTTSSASDSGMFFPISGTFTAGNTYSASFKFKAITAATYSLSIQGTASSSGRDIRTLAAGEEATFRHTWTPTATGGITFYALRQGGQSGTSTFYVDGAILVDGSTPYTYDSTGMGAWLWTGSAGVSTSIGPALPL